MANVKTMKPDQEEAFIVTSENVQYHVYLRTRFKMDGSILSTGYRVAGKRHGCVSMTLMDGTLALNGLDYHEKCIMGGPDMRMPRGDGTVKMLRVSLAFMMNKFAASIQTITLSDASHVPCRFADGDVRSVSLMNSYIAVHGQTWYESKFGAVMLVILPSLRRFLITSSRPTMNRAVFAS